MNIVIPICFHFIPSCQRSLRPEPGCRPPAAVNYTATSAREAELSRKTVPGWLGFSIAFGGI